MNTNALNRLTYGMYVVCSKNKKGDRFNGQLANTVFQVTSDPPTVAVSINKKNFSHEFIKESGVFTVSVLKKDTPLMYIGNFGFKSGRDTDKFKSCSLKTGMTGVNIPLDNAVAYLEAEVIKSEDILTHTLFIGKVIAAEILSEDEPMTYAYYHEVKRGPTPKSAPTFNTSK